MKILVLLFAALSVAVATPQFKPYNPIDYTPKAIPKLAIPSPNANAYRIPSPPPAPIVAPVLPPPAPVPARVVPSLPLPPPPAPVRITPHVNPPVNSDNGHWRIVKQAKDEDNDGSYQYSYETENGIVVQESSVQLNRGLKEEAKAAQGSYSYTAPDGNLITVTYTADEGGFQPQGAHLPVGPPIPDLILRALQYIEAHPPPPESSIVRRQ